jgi:hypothetical protein
MGRNRFTCTLLVRRDDRWTRLNRFDFKVSKSDEVDATMSAVTDWNGDGFSDVVVSDDREGLRAFVSNNRGGLIEEERGLGESGAVVLFLPRRIMRAVERARGWQVDLLAVRP